MTNNILSLKTKPWKELRYIGDEEFWEGSMGVSGSLSSTKMIEVDYGQVVDVATNTKRSRSCKYYASSQRSIKYQQLTMDDFPPVCTIKDVKMIDDVGERTVATKSGQVPINIAKQSSPRAASSISTARHVNTVAPKPKVKDAFPTTYSYFKAHSLIIKKLMVDLLHLEEVLKEVKLLEKGKIRTGKLDFEDVYFVKELKFNLFSISQMCDKKNSVLFTKTECLVLSPDFKLLDESQVLLKVPRHDNMYNFDLKNVVPSGGLTCLFAKATIDESNLWHRRLGHINFKTMNKLVRGNLVRGLPSKLFENDHTCVACQKGKQHKASCKTKLVSSISQPLQMLHMDLFGPTSVRSINHKTYCLVVTDDFSRFSWVFFLATKDETSGILKTFITGIENQINHKVKIIRCDNGTEFKNNDMNQFCGMKGIKREFSVARTPQQNSKQKWLTERKNKTLIEAARIMLANSLLPTTFWAEATLVDLPKGKRAIGTKWVYRNKKDKRGIVVRNKYRLVAQGYTQEEGIDYDEVFALVARIEAIRLFLAYASFMGFIVYQMDVKSAFLYGTIEEEVYVCQPPSFEDPMFPDKVYKVEKALYGLHQAPKAWYETLSTYLLENGYRRGTIDKTLFIKKDRGDILLVQVYVDDIIFGSTKKSLCVEFEQMMHKRFQMSSMRVFTFFLGLQVMQKDDGIFISQDKYVADILKNFDFVTIKTASTPIKTNKALLKDEEAEDVHVYLYRSIIRSLMYLIASRLDIMFSICVCARFQVTPKVSHLHAVKRIFRYLKGQPKLGLWYPMDSSFDFEAFSDSNYAGASLNRKSITGAEYVAAANCYGQVYDPKKSKLLIMGLTSKPKIHIDNESTICIVKNLVFHSKTKHIEIRHHFIRDSYEKKLIQVIKIHTDHNVADLLTKAFDSSGPIHLVKDETVYKEWEDIMERATTTASRSRGGQWLNLLLPVLVYAARHSLTTVRHKIQALVYKKKVIISETSIRSDLKLDDAEGTNCLPTATIFVELERMGAKTTSWNEFSSTMAYVIICLATNQKFNIFDNMVKNLDGGVKILMYPRFVEVFLEKQVEGMSKHKGVYVTPFHSKKVFANMNRPCKGFSGRVTPIFSTMMVQATEDMCWELYLS
ncbi:putative ribonuclease H-like domain-containing protein [Tanacetum coccineum]|uniref:Ribonuclease H-like domain-containing protein n=1 Tax=Tanacetum coccineum TaxID=301880 RepID=A0ABQ5C5W6_9ASTR